MRYAKWISVLAALVAMWMLSTPVYAQFPVTVVVETEILKTDPLPGIKTQQTVQVDFARKTIRQEFNTGKTDLGITQLDSIRNAFKIEDVVFANSKTTFTLRGQAASGVGFLPDIDYRFTVTLWPDGHSIIRGCHDGYPAYRVKVAGRQEYFFPHGELELSKLLGICDIRLPEVGADKPGLTVTSTQIVPDGAGTGAIFFEASSRHAAVRLFYDDPLARSTRAPVYAIAPSQGKDSIESYAALRRASEQLLAGQGSLGAASSAIIKGSWASLVQPIALPHADFRFIVRADSEVVKAINDKLKDRVSKLDEELKSVNTAANPAVVFQVAAKLLNEAASHEALRIPVDSTGRRMPLPDPAKYASGLAWAMAYAYQSEGHAAMAGCEPTPGGVLPFKGTGDTTVLRAYLDVLAQASEARVFSPFAAGFLTRPSGGKSFVLDTAQKTLKAIGSAVWRSDFGSFLALGQIDPARLLLARCKGARMLRGPLDPADFIVERSVMYGVASTAIEAARTGQQKVRFFDAARAVTQLLGVGMVDLADDVDIDNKMPVVTLARELLASTGCIPENAMLLPEPRDRALLRHINAELLAFNQPRIKRLLASPQAWFDPVTMGRFEAPETMTAPFYFDLRMVVAEQYHVEKLLRSEKLGQDKARDDTLSAAERALRCIAGNVVLQQLRESGVGLPQLDLLASVDGLLKAAIASASLPAFEQRFSSLRWRIAIGSAYVFALHRPHDIGSEEWRKQYVAYLRTLFDSMHADSRRNAGVSPALTARIEGVLRGATARWDETSRLPQVKDAAHAYLARTPDKKLYRCDRSGAVPVLKTGAFPRSVSQRERIGRLRQYGVGIIALPFELAAEGGALQPHLAIDAGSAADFCAALDVRHSALECAVSPTPSAGCNVSSAVSPGRDGKSRLLLMENAVGLRSDLGHLAPFLIPELRRLPGSFGNEELQNAVGKSALRESIYRRNLALASILKTQPPGTLRALKVNQEPSFWRDLVAQAETPGAKNGPLVNEGGTVDEAAMKAFAADHELEAQITRIEATDAALAKAVQPLAQPSAASDDAALGAATGAATATAAETPRTALDRLGGAKAGETGLGLELVETGQSAAGGRLHDAVLVYRRWQAASSAAICSSKADPKATCAAPLSTDGGTQSEAISGERTPQRIPLGLRLTGLALDKNGRHHISSTLGDADIDVDSQQTKAALYELGLPRSVDLDTVDFEVSRDVRAVTLKVKLSIAGLQGVPISLPLVREGDLVDPSDALKEQAVAALQSLLTSQADRLRLDLAITPARDLPIALRLKPGSIKPSIDWAGGTLTAAADLELAIGSTPGFVAGASAELFVDRSGAAVRRISFASVDPKALVDAVKNLGPLKALADMPGLSIVPEVAGGRIALHVRAVKEFDGCEVAVETSIELANPKLGLDALTESIAKAARDTAICQASRKMSDIASFLSKQELDLFGLKVTFDFAAVQARGGIAAGRLPLPLQFVAGQFDTCKQPPKQARLEGFAIAIDGQLTSFKVDLAGLSPPERLALGAALGCRLMAAVAPVSGFLSIGNVEVGHRIAAADLTFSGLPLLGNITMRVDFADPAADPSRILYGAIAEKSQATLAAKLEQAAKDGLSLPGVGTFRPEPGKFELDLIDKKNLSLKDDRTISVTGGLRIANSYDVKARIVFPLNPGRLGTFRIELPEGVAATVVNQLVSTVSNLLPFPGNGVKVIAPRIAKLDDTGHRWGLVFGLTVEMELGGQGFRIAVQRVAISPDGIELDREIRLGLKTPMYFGPVALSQIIVIYHTGSGGGAKGLALGADLTALEPQFANVLKIESILDLRDIARSRFELRGRLIAFNSVALLEATGLVDLIGQEARFDAATTDTIKAIIKASADGEIIGRGVNLFNAKSSMELLGVDMGGTRVSFCTKSCDTLFPDGGSAKLSVSQRFLFGTGDLDAATDLEFRDPGLKAGVGLDLFGWKPGRAGFSASTRLARLELSFLGLKVGVTTPTVELMTPALIADVLKSLLDVDLKNLLKLPKDIEISLMKSDGSIGAVSAGGSSSPAASNSGNGGEGAAVPAGIQPGPGQGTLPAVPGANGAPPAEIKTTGPAQPFWGTSITGIYCEKVSGSNNGLAISDGDRFELWAQVFNPASAAQSPLLQGIHPHPGPTPWHSPTLSAETARRICAPGNAARTLQLQPDLLNVGVARAPIGWRNSGCENNIPEFRYFRFNRTDEKRRSQFTNAQRAVLCYQIGSQRYDIEARLLWKQAGGYLAILYCPSASSEVKSTLATMPGWAAACGDGRPGYVELTSAAGEASVISDRTELDLIEDRLRGLLLNSDAPPKSNEVIDSGEFSFGNAVVRFEQRNVFGSKGQIEAMRFDLELPTDEAGATRVELLRLAKPDDLNSSLWTWLQPDRKGVRAELLRRWLSTGRRPHVIGSWLADGWLALQLSKEAETERQLWLKDMGAAEPGAWTLDAPLAPPESTIVFGASEVVPWMNGLKALVPYFKSQPSWTLTLGAARETGMAVYAFWAGEKTSVTDAFADRLIVHLHPLPKLPAAKEAIWTGGAKPPGRTLCGTASGIVPKMRALAEPALANRVTLASALTNADAMTKSAGLKVHVFGILGELLGKCQ